ncbi:hypothetical protein BJ875DRAFT_370317 [Amylocarpus encephaloides]|uniref:Copper-fist domain-containing protein n=1 Tax=Amylocarpus encephaloides TaxID=45428 RepID=A0A9P8C8B2_9HELO|nr:hypothetical protein BJ875DRAFT_370317 [Amylocarpus encephaloides]
MPLINGMKMACEPCIRGHRSTKCTHANERLMVPVRKPGRPLSQCPHPGGGQSCMCGSVTAAIPRKQACRCGGEGSPASTTVSAATPIVPRAEPISTPDLPSPTKTSFKIQKSQRPASASRKQSYSSNLERMDTNSINVVPFKQQPMPPNVPVSGGYSMVGPSQNYGYAPQYSMVQTQYASIAIQPHPMSYESSSPIVAMNGFSNGITSSEDQYAVESPLATPTICPMQTNGILNGKVTGGSYCAPAPSNTNGSPINGESKPIENSSRCASKENGHGHTSSISNIIAEVQEQKPKSCCSSKSNEPLKQESMIQNGVRMQTNGAGPPQMMAPGGMPFVQAYYPQYVSHDPTVFTYPPGYGSFQNPIQPAAWRESFRTNNYSPHPTPSAIQSPPCNGSMINGGADTVHTCGCGDGCQCVGCVAHPYNDTTMAHVRSAAAWQMSMDHSGGEMYTNGYSQPETPTLNRHSNGNGAMHAQNGEQVASPTANTPSSSNSGSGDEQTLPESDFLFVSYSFAGEGCAGESLSCPCGDDCQCVGCTIHQQPQQQAQSLTSEIPGMPCGGAEDACPCGDNCECIGCVFHGNASA